MKVVTPSCPFKARLGLLRGSSGWYGDCKCSKSSNSMLDVCSSNSMLDVCQHFLNQGVEAVI